MPKKSSSHDVPAEKLEKTCGAGPRGPETNPVPPKPKRTDLDHIPDDDVADYGLGSRKRRRDK